MTFSLVLSSSCDAIADPPTVTAKSVVAAGAESQATAAESNGRTVRLDAERVNEIPTIEYDKQFRVVLTNSSQQPLRIFSPDSRSGFYELSFQFMRRKLAKYWLCAIAKSKIQRCGSRLQKTLNLDVRSSRSRDGS